MLRKLLFWGGIMLWGGVAYTQQSFTYMDVQKAYREGLELFDEKNYLSARGKFDEIYRQCSTSEACRAEVIMQNIEYYIAVCAVEANTHDALLLLQQYQQKYHETDKRRMLYFYSGKYYYRNNKYNEAADELAKVNISDLNNAQLYDYKFMMGYTRFLKKKFTEAKPFFAAIKDVQDKYYYPANYYYAFISFYLKDYNEALKSFTAIQDSKMYESVIPYYLAQIYFIKNDYTKLIPYIKTNLEKDAVLYKDEMRLLLGQVYFQQNEYEKALPLLENYVRKSDKVRKEDIYQLAYCQYKTGAYNKAIDNLKQLNLLNEPLGQSATYTLADCYLKTNQKDKARSAFGSAAAMKFDEQIAENALYNYGKISFESNYHTEAIQSFESYLEKYPKGIYYDDVQEMLVNVLVQTKNYERTYKIMERMKNIGPSVRDAYQRITYYRAIELYNDKRIDEALDLCNKSLKYTSNLEITALCTYLKADILYNKGMYPEAAELFKQFIPMSTPAVERTGEASKFRANYNIGYCYFKRKNYKDAVLYFDNAIKQIDKTNDIKGTRLLMPDLYLRYADCNFVTKNYNVALDAYSVIVTNKWSSAEYAQFQKGVILGLTGRFNDKINAMSNLTVLFPNSVYTPQAYYEIGETYTELDNYKQAKTAYQNIISKYPQSDLLPKCFLKVAVIEYNSGNKEAAIESYKNVVQRYPKTKVEKEALDALKEIYVELGRADEYVDYVKNKTGVNITQTEQDSLTYISADNMYRAGDCTKATGLFAGYLQKFPNGIFTQDVQWKKADCHLRTKQFEEALTLFESLIQHKFNSYYERSLLKATGIAYYELKDYQRANALYKLLYIASTSQTNTYTALTGLLQSAVMLNRHEDVLETADQLLNSGLAKESDVQNAYYQKGKAFYAMANIDFALGAFNRVAEYPVNEKCVESKYMVAKILFEKQQYKASLDTCFRLKNKYASYEYWVVKTFILIADNYYAQNNTFQAKATLESIIENYEGDVTIIAEAKAKLEKIREEEINKSKLMIVPPSDTLILESDSILINRQ